AHLGNRDVEVEPANGDAAREIRAVFANRCEEFCAVPVESHDDALTNVNSCRAGNARQGYSRRAVPALRRADAICRVGVLAHRVFKTLSDEAVGESAHATLSCGCAGLATDKTNAKPRISPSPGTPGEGRGEGLILFHGRALTLTLSRSTGRGNQYFQSRMTPTAGRELFRESPGQ